uniref:L-lactate dehydrogenase complex protein LldF n=1 Tax=Candidatus Kentrum sp. FM TaxID=2126340 RepID=A0A450TF00_9GAMM|nr:MAG: L-lactate dehydrogenase complex protein LldF [Candidatus Kentron sp. FM]VFJ65934.1 MAG: L-lactate dehydrogenase complex protein LldF [Candidatus Kentron sp. FM]VFK15834.1 MAG: L-lactate dehydrogenase complex protein LldF [Candidatus Kentron sp. FM]
MKSTAQVSETQVFTTQAFKTQAVAALSDDNLQTALARAHGGFVRKRGAALDAFPEFEALREAGRAIKVHTLSHLDFYLTRYEAEVTAHGGHVHWARTCAEACGIITGICTQNHAKRVIKGKSMIGEEIGINRALEEADLHVTETDLGEYIIQLAGETPSHIIAPAVHKTRDRIARLFQTHHAEYGFTQRRTQVSELVDEARQVLRKRFLAADVGITGANFLIAETGSNILVTNEGNGDLSSTLPRVHIVIASIEKVVPTLEDATTLLRLLGRSATGQVMTSYTTLSTGPRRPADPDGPEEYHVVLIDNGRSEILGTSYREILHCIRCGACLNYCPVYGAIGGHAYGWVYPGPMGAVLTPLLMGRGETLDLPNACTLDGRCRAVCPTAIDLPNLIRRLRIDAWQHKESPRATRWLGRRWAFFAKHPRLYARLTAFGAKILGAFGGRRGLLQSLPLLRAWTGSRELPAPQGKTFQAQWKRQKSI